MKLNTTGTHLPHSGVVNLIVVLEYSWVFVYCWVKASFTCDNFQGPVPGTFKFYPKRIQNRLPNLTILNIVLKNLGINKKINSLLIGMIS